MLLDLLHRPDGLQPFYQPIFHVDGASSRRHAIECLMRGPRGTTIEPAPILFEYVRQTGAEARVDRLCVSRALGVLSRSRGLLDDGTMVCLNVHGVTLALDDGFVDFLCAEAQRNGFACWQLTVEILEFRSFAGNGRMRTAIDAMHAAGMRIAVDDLGNAESNLRMLLECHADYFKLDQHFIRGIDTDPFRRALVEAVAAMAPRFGAWVVAEGVETAAELETVQRLGVALAQGYHLAAPRAMEAEG